MKIIIIFGIILLSTFVHAQQLSEVYLVTLKFSNDIVTLEEIKVIEGLYSEIATEQDQFFIQIADFKGKALFQRGIEFQRFYHLDPPAEWFDEEGNQIFIPGEDDIVVLDEVENSYILPYFSNAKYFQVVRNDGELVLSADISRFSASCGNNICEAHESYNTCSTDCRSGKFDQYCDGIVDDICDPDCSIARDRDCLDEISILNRTGSLHAENEAEDSSKFRLFIVLAGVIMVMATIVLIIAHSKNEDY